MLQSIERMPGNLSIGTAVLLVAAASASFQTCVGSNCVQQCADIAGNYHENSCCGSPDTPLNSNPYNNLATCIDLKIIFQQKKCCPGILTATPSNYSFISSTKHLELEPLARYQFNPESSVVLPLLRSSVCGCVRPEDRFGDIAIARTKVESQGRCWTADQLCGYNNAPCGFSDYNHTVTKGVVSVNTHPSVPATGYPAYRISAPNQRASVFNNGYTGLWWSLPNTGQKYNLYTLDPVAGSLTLVDSAEASDGTAVGELTPWVNGTTVVRFNSIQVDRQADNTVTLHRAHRSHAWANTSWQILLSASKKQAGETQHAEQ